MSKASLYHHVAGCADCDFYVDARNAMGLAAKHHYKTGHAVSCEVGYVWKKIMLAYYAEAATKEVRK